MKTFRDGSKKFTFEKRVLKTQKKPVDREEKIMYNKYIKETKPKEQKKKMKRKPNHTALMAVYTHTSSLKDLLSINKNKEKNIKTCYPYMLLSI